MSLDVVITGGAGWLGRGLLRRADDLAGTPGARVRALALDEAEASLIREVRPDAEVVVGDIAAPGVGERLLAGCAGARVVHAAGIIHPRRVDDFDRINRGGTESLVAAARSVSTGRLVLVSSTSPVGVNGAPDEAFDADSPYRPYMGYGRSKMMAEIAVREAQRRGEVDGIVVRAPWFYGPDQPERQTRFLQLVRAGRFPIVGRGDSRRSMVYIDNLVDGIAAALRTPEPRRRVYWVADARPYSQREILETVRRALRDEGLEVKDGAPRLPGFTSRAAAAVDGLIQRTGRYNQEIHVMGEIGQTIACDISATTADLGYVPSVDLYEGMRASVRWCREAGLPL